MDVQTSSTLVFFVNGKKVKDDNVDPSMTLLEYLRLKLRLCGTKLGCAEGGCGACTVMVSSYDRINKIINHFSVNACLAPVCSMHGLAVTTIEGIGSTKSKTHPVQERIAKSHGSQCGFCTPGIVMSMYTLLRNKTKPSVEDLGDTFQGNLCRCTGYRPILQGFQTFTEGNCCLSGKNVTNGKCCQMVNSNDEIGESKGSCCQTNGINETNSACCKTINGLALEADFIPYDPSKEPIFPPELQLSDVYDKEYLIFENEKVKWIRPNTLAETLEIKYKFPEAKLVVGNTEIGIEVKFKKCHYPLLVALTNIKELKKVEEIEEGLMIGAAVSLSQLQDICKKMIVTQPEFKTRIFKAIDKMLNVFGGKQIRNVGSIGGNLMALSPISDLNPILLAANCVITAASKNRGLRKITLDQNFFSSYRKTLIKADEIVLNIFIPFTVENEFFYAYKQAKRREDDIAIVNAAYRLLLTGDRTVQDISMAYGGMAPTTVKPLRTPAAIKGRKWNDDLIDIACRYLEDDLPLQPDAPGSMIAFRRSLATSFFFKFYLSVSTELGKLTKEFTIPENYKTAVLDHFNNEPIKASQYYKLPGDGQKREDMVGRPVVHLSGIKQATGEAVYCDDIPQYQNELHLALVVSEQAHAKVLSINPEPATQMSGVVTFLCYKDVYYNKMGIFDDDEEVFASTTVTCQGQVIGAIVAIDRKTAQLAARAVVIDYEPLTPVIITIEDAIRHQSFNGEAIYVQNGDPLTEFATADHCLEGEMRVGAQEHFYLETQCSIAIPKNEDDEMEIISSTQTPTGLQMNIAKVLGVQVNRIKCTTKRVGGAFGGKEFKSSLVAVPCAIAAKKLGRPVRCMLDREEDMVITGARHPFLGKYKVGFSNEGKIVAVDTKFFSNIGNTLDLSQFVMSHCLLGFEGAYYLPHVRGTGTLCSTNLASFTAFRGFGVPQGCIVTEAMIDQVASFLGKEPSQIRELNLFEEGRQTPYKQEVVNCTIKRCWSDCMEMSDYKIRRLEVDEWNKNNRWKKRGLAIIPSKYPCSFDIKFLNQAGALIHVYNDGSVLISHGGVELGQGLHTKMIQIASRVLEIPITKIHISDTSTDKVPNTTATAGSFSSDLYGMAIIDGCNKIKQRLEPIVRAIPQASWEEWIKAAYLQSVSLSATGFYAEKDIIDFDFKNQTGKPFLYYSFGVGCSEVEIDCLTGDHTVIRTDIVMDVGESLNPAIDVGQIEGAFVQGYGLFMMEEHRYSPEGYLYTRGPGMYKIPGFGDIPKEFNVALLKTGSNPRAVYSSKAVGEPPLFLSASVYFAIKNAISSARADEGQTDFFQLNCPATAERIRMACVDRFTQQILMPDPATYKPWSFDHL